MMSKHFKLPLVAAVTASCLLLTACGGGQANADKVTLEFPSWQAEDPAFGPWWKELIAAYEKENPDVSIDYYQIPFGSFVDQMTTRFAANDQPDIVQLPARNATEFASRGWLEPMGDRISATDITTSWTPLQKEMNWDGQPHGVLLLGYGYTLYYNEALLRAAGVAVPTSTEELVRAAQAVTGDGKYGFGATTQQSPDNYTELMSFVVGNGASLSDDQGKFQANSPAVIEAMNQYRQVLKEAPAGLQSQQRNELFLNGNIAMLLDGPFFRSELKDAVEGVAGALKTAAPPFEYVPGGVSNSIHIPSGLDDAEEDAVWEFIELAASPTWQKRYAELASVPAPRKDSITPEAVQSNPDLELFQELAEKATTIFPTAPGHRESFSRISQIVSQAAVRLISTDDPTEDVAADLQSELEKSVRNNQ